MSDILNFTKRDAFEFLRKADAYQQHAKSEDCHLYKYGQQLRTLAIKMYPCVEEGSCETCNCDAS